jgi:hypothetical protein
MPPTVLQLPEPAPGDVPVLMPGVPGVGAAGAPEVAEVELLPLQPVRVAAIADIAITGKMETIEKQIFCLRFIKTFFLEKV